MDNADRTELQPDGQITQEITVQSNAILTLDKTEEETAADLRKGWSLIALSVYQIKKISLTVHFY